MKITQEIYKKRRKRLRALAGSATIIVPSGRAKVKSRDQHHNFSVNPDFLYLTGIDGPNESGCYLLMSEDEELLFSVEQTREDACWNGPRVSFSQAKRISGIKTILNVSEFVIGRVEEISFPLGVDELLDGLCLEVMRSSVAPRAAIASRFTDVRLYTAQLRIKKDSTEKKLIKECCKLTSEAFEEALADISSFSNELEFARHLESMFCSKGLEGASFNTIVASGANATTLHHQPVSANKIKKGQLVLVDAGSRLNGYCSDITRTVSSSGEPNEIQQEVLSIVAEALEEAISRTRAGIRFSEVSLAAEKVLAQGLKDIKVLKGSVSSILKAGKHKRFFPHGIGHHLGLDVHDIVPKPVPAKLETGNVITIEPGLYFDSDSPKHVRGIGVRLEEDVYVTNKGCEVLTR